MNQNPAMETLAVFKIRIFVSPGCTAYSVTVIMVGPRGLADALISTIKTEHVVV
jgi:hypothetical protein